jgi:alpha-galactosidase
VSFFDLLRGPDRVTAIAEDGASALVHTDGRWSAPGVEVVIAPSDEALPVLVRAPSKPLLRLQLRWRIDTPANLLYLGDHWERAYGDAAWRSIVPERHMPWYFLAYDGQVTHGYGVAVQPNTLCCWQVDDAGVSLWLDLACGGVGVRLGERELRACTVVTRRGIAGESVSGAARAFARRMSPSPRLASQPVYGANDWYHAYAKSTGESILRDAAIVSELSPSANRPFQVIDGGWAKHQNKQGCEGGPWDPKPSFGDMATLAAGIRSRGARPGLWYRPLLWEEDLPAGLALAKDRFTGHERSHILDPTVPDALAKMRGDLQRFRAWGYELIKHDFSTWDILGRWGFRMNFQVTDRGWAFADRSKTTAEAVLMLYRALREGAGDMLLIGCNVIGHLAAGLVELNRTGDDTSGLSWERTRKMGVNALAFRTHQHDIFFAGDADCVGLTLNVPWELNRQWLDLLARSGTPLFVSADPKVLGADQRAALRSAFARAAQPQPLGEPIDWLYSTAPSYWRFGEESVHYDWYGDEGVHILEPV